LTLRVNQSLAKTTAIVDCRSARPPRLIQIVAPFSSRLSRNTPDINKAQENRRIAPVPLRRRYRLNTNSIDAVRNDIVVMDNRQGRWGDRLNDYIEPAGVRASPCSKTSVST
jgi:hypothetical protein